MAHFSDALAAAVQRRGNPVCVGLDPRWEQLPAGLTAEVTAGLPGRAAAYVRFCQGVVDVVAPLAPVVKPQMAFFEQLGPPGMAALAEVASYASSRGLLVILDGKRNDIGSTAEAYADGLLGRAAPWGADAITASPYLGADSVAPLVDTARERSAGVFVLVKTSNPGGGMLQDLIADGRPIYRHVGEFVEQLAEQSQGACGYGCVGAVVGATYPEQLATLRGAMPHAWFLIPGFGSQGGAAKDVAGGFDARGLGGVVNSSRGIIFAARRKEYADRFGDQRWQEAVDAATREMIDQLRADTPAGTL